MNIIFICILGITLTTFIYLNSKKISLQTNLFKKGFDETPLLGGVGIYFLFILGVFFGLVFEKEIIQVNSYLLIFSSIIFFIGIVDDIFDLSYNFRLISIFLLLVLFLFLDNRFVLNELYFETNNKTYTFKYFSYFLTPFFILLMLNSMNMADGINGNSGLIFLSYIFLLYDQSNELNFFIVFIIISLIIFLIFNLKNKLYMGDSGIYFLSILISLYTIYEYKFGNSNLSCEKIFMFFMIPGIDMFRLFCLRISKKKNPFKGDLNHLHHLLIKKYSHFTSLVIYIFLILWPNLILKLFIFSPIYLIILNIIIYSLTVVNLNFYKKSYN